MSTAAAPNRRGSGRSGLLYTLLCLALLAGVIPALHPPQPPVPPTAAYAPEAAQNPQQAPQNQSSVNGKGDSSNGQGANGAHSSPTPSPTPAIGPGGTDITPRDLDCVITPGYPARQVEDTQSPPCIPSWHGDNGGATSPGVTGTTINVIAPEGINGNTEFQSYISWVNHRFEFYGRSINVIQGGCGADQQTSKDNFFSADAQKARNKGAFASFSYCDEGGQEALYYDDLARLGIVSVSARPDARTEAEMASSGGNPWYEWSYLPSVDYGERSMAALVCRQLANSHAPLYTPAPGGQRKFGIIYSKLEDISQGSSAGDYYQSLSTDIQQDCGVPVDPGDIRGIKYVTSQQSTGYQNYDQQSLQDAQAAAARFFQDGVTTVLSVAHSEDTLECMEGADNIGGYHPEWVVSNYFYDNTEPLSPNPPQDQWSHAFGFDAYNRLEPVQDEAWYWPLVQEDPNYSANPYVPERYYGLGFLYPQVLLLASGIQMAGPNLTPQTFAEGLWHTQFPNPPSPYNEGKVGFADDHSMVKDVTLEWYSATNPGPWGGQQATWCFVDAGRRYRAWAASGNGADAYIPDDPNYYNSHYFTTTCDP